MSHRPNELEQETSLYGGNQAIGVVRVGDTVRRPAQTWSPAIRVLLDRLDTVTPGIAPRPRGVDARGRDIVSFIAGDVGHYPLAATMRSEQTLVEAARLLRRYHEATAALVSRTDLPWQFVDLDPARHEVICHNDVAPYNTVYREGRPVALIDFDHAGPGPRLRDVAYAAYRFVPLASDRSCRDFGWKIPPDRGDRLRQFLDAYGPFDDFGFIAMVERRIRDLRDDILHLAATEPDRVAVHLEEDHVGSYNSDLAWIADNREALERVLTSG